MSRDAPHLLQAVDRVAPSIGPGSRHGMLVSEESPLLHRILERHYLDPLDGYDVLTHVAPIVRPGAICEL